MNPLPSGPFGCVLADPPWSFKTWSGKTGTPHRTANDHYITTETTALCDIPVASVCLPDCALFMWVVDSHIDEAIDLGRAWGFKLKTRAFTWRKIAANGNARIGMGYWTRKQTEMCLLFTRGKVKRKDKGVREIIDAPRREHSRKPDEQYNRIERLVDGPYLEMFSRQAWPDWAAWGNQTGTFEADPVAAQAQPVVAPANDNHDLFSSTPHATPQATRAA